MAKLEIIDNFNGLIKNKINELRPDVDKLEEDDSKVYKFKLINKITKKIIDTIFPIVFKDNDQIFVYYNGFYHIDGDKDIRTACGIIFGDYYNDDYLSKIISKIKAVKTIDRDDFMEHGEFLNVRNGVLDLRTLELLPHDSKYNFIYKCDINYDKNEDDSKINKFFSEAVSNENDLMCLQEYSGYILYPTYQLNDLDKLLMVWGRLGKNRKTKSLNLMTKLLGDKIVSSSELYKLAEDRFEASMLYGKKANIKNDISNKKITDTSTVKNLVGGDKITAQRKHERQFQFYNNAKLIFSCNELPEIIANSPAFWKKIILLEFPNDFGDDSLIMNELLSEEGKSAFLNWALKGLHRLMENKVFTYDHSTTEERWIEYRTLKNPIIDFWNYHVLYIGMATSEIEKSELYQIYRLYCYNLKEVPETYNKFCRLIKDMNIEDGRATVENKDGKRPDMWKGYQINHRTFKLLTEKLKFHDIIKALRDKPPKSDKDKEKIKLTKEDVELYTKELEIDGENKWGSDN